MFIYYDLLPAHPSRFCLPAAVDLTNPTTIIWVIEDKFYTDMHRPDAAQLHKPRVFIGREVAQGPRKMISEYELNKRPFIGTTSMKPELSFLVFVSSLFLFQHISLLLIPLLPHPSPPSSLYLSQYHHHPPPPQC